MCSFVAVERQHSSTVYLSISQKVNMNKSNRKRNVCQKHLAITKMTEAPPTPAVESDDAQFMRDRENSALCVIRAAVEGSQATIARVVHEQLDQLDWHKDMISSYRLTEAK
jgi:hypothetical protein